MERLNNSSVRPTDVSFQMLKEITNNFSQKVGHGAYGEVYKGVYNGKDVAVKKLYGQRGLDDNLFKNELNSLMRVHHQNIVQLLGYCDETSCEYVHENGERFSVTTCHRVLCFEYLHGGSLDKHMYEESSGHDWCTRYKIIKGICEGLNYLHVGLKKPIFHLDLKPANILLDKNMVPKIADFGLSRLFNGTHSHITGGDKFKGTLAYVPPEYILSRHVTDKYDIFSLGIIIIQIMTGAEGRYKYVEMSSPQQFLELVHNNWRNRLEATSMYVEEYCQQVKRCIEIASNCLEADRKKRPTIGHIINELIRTETVICEPFPGESSSASTVEERSGGEEDEVELTMIGPWGGNAGKAHTIKGASHRLESVTIWSAVIVDALAFSYSETNGKMHNVGPWGGPGGSANTIHFGPSEFLLEVSGTTGPSYLCEVADVVKSVKLVTNAGSYGPFGSGGGTSFKTSVQNNGSIVGFFGRGERYVHAIGVYMSHSTPTIAVSRTVQREMESNGMKANFNLETIEEGDTEDDDNVGPWGGNGGTPRDMKVVPHRMESMTVYSDAVVNSLAFSYNDRNGKQQILGPWGGPGGSSYTIRLGAFEHLKGIVGTFGPFDGAFEHLKGIVGTFGPFDAAGNIITSLTFTTNARSYGPFGRGGGTGFRVPVEVHGSVVGFFGRAGTYLDALGVYIRTY